MIPSSRPFGLDWRVMASARSQQPPKQGATGSLLAGVLLTALAILWPLAATLLSLSGPHAAEESGPKGWMSLGASTLLPTVVVVGAIAMLATVMALPAAHALARASGGRAPFWLALIVSPMLLPSYLPYAGWGLIRGPGTWIGDYLARCDPAISVWAGYIAAVLGMVLWAWPIPALILSRRISRLDSSTSDCMQLDVPQRLSRWLTVLRLLRGSLVISVLAVALLMVGSSIPLHVAQVPTYTIELWKAMQLTPDLRSTWITSAPLVFLAAGVGAAAARWCVTGSPHIMQASPRRPAGLTIQLATWVGWALSVVGPFLLFAWSTRSSGSLTAFWSISGWAVLESVRTGGMVAIGGVALCLIIWRLIGLGGKPRWVAAIAVGCWTFGGVMPGVLVGQAAAGTFGKFPWMQPVIVPLTHSVRFGWLAAILGCWLARVEPLEERWMARLDGGRFVAWWQTSVVGQVRAVGGLAVALAVLSINEIESTIFVQPPGRGNLAQQLLDYLHYARDEQLSAASVNLLGLGASAALAAGWLLGGVRTKVQRSLPE